MAISTVRKAGMLWLQVPWRFLHFMVTLWFYAVRTVKAIKNYAISIGLLTTFKALDLTNLKYLAIVIDSEDAHQTSKIIKLLQWLADVGITHISLYDMEGVLKKSKDSILEKTNASLWEDTRENESFVNGKHLTMEFLSLSDGKEAVAKAANYLFANKLKFNKLDGGHEPPVFTESDVSGALRAIGCGGPAPDLLLIYGPVRCHLGFPAWRLPYTEIVHMGPLKSMGYGSLIEVIHKFTLVRQNYGK